VETRAGLLVRELGTIAYIPAWEAMRAFSDARDDATPDELWDARHPPVYTLGVAGRDAHLLRRNGIPVVKCDRGGQVTYHGPGQAIVYALLDLRRAGLGVRQLVTLLERAAIEVLASYGIEGHARADAPGVYVGGAKIASLGLRIRHGRSYHGIALNVDMDLAPFRDIDPCGHPGQVVTQIADLVAPTGGVDEAARRLTRALGDVVPPPTSSRSSS
jgi:lipoyl(octanoyl) transferase